MKLIQKTFGEFSNVTVSFFIVKEMEHKNACGNTLLIEYAHDTPVTRDDITYMIAMRLAAVKLWNPDAIILDMRAINYKYGDTMEYMFRNPYMPPNTVLQIIFNGNEVRPCHVVAIVSDVNRNGFVSLIENEMGNKSDDYLFASTTDALCYINSKYTSNK